MTDFDLIAIQGSDLTQDVGALRYALYIAGQGKTYPSADHGRKLLFDDLDLISTHVVCRAPGGCLLSALRLTPIETARHHAFFAPLLMHAQAQLGACVILSRLVRAETLAAARSISPLFKFAYDLCLDEGWSRGLIQTSPRLAPLFHRYGWRTAGQTFDDIHAGAQVPLWLDATDTAHLDKIGSPYLQDPHPTGRNHPCKERSGARTAI